MKAKRPSKNKKGYRKTKKKIDKKKLYVTLVGFFIVFLMVASLLVLDGEEDNSYEYNGYLVTQGNGFWNVAKEGASLAFEYDPLSLENYSIESFYVTSDKIYLAYNPTVSDLQSFEFRRLYDFLNSIGVSVVPSCIDSLENCPDIPFVSCDEEKDIIKFEEGKEVKIILDENCVVLKSSKDKALEVVNLYMYRLFGVL